MGDDRVSFRIGSNEPPTKGFAGGMFCGQGKRLP